MPAGTITLTNGSASVSGNGTSFTTELKAGDFIGVNVGGAPYTMIVASIASNTQLTISLAYNGQTASGLAWYGVPATLKYAITQQVLNDMATNQRGMIAQLANWQKIYSDAASVTVERSDRSTFTGPSWGYMSTQLTKNSNDPRLDTVNNKSGGVITGDVSLEGNNLNIRSITPSGGWPAFVNFMAGQGNNVTFARVYSQAAGRLTFAVDVSGTPKYTYMNTDGSMQVPGSITCTSLTQTSDKNKKENIAEITDALSLIDNVHGYTYTLKENQKEAAGILAQEWQEILPSVVTEFAQEDVIYDEEGTPTGEVIKSSSLSVDYSGVTAFLLSALRELKVRNDNMTKEMDEIKARLKTMDGLTS